MDQESDPFDAFRLKCKKSTSRTYDLHREAAAKQDWLAAGVWGSIFLEAFLDEACRALNVRPDRDELGAQISRLQALKDRPNVQEVVRYCDIVRNARNGLFHARENVEPVTFSKTIQDYLPKILDLARPWFANTTSEKAEPETSFPTSIGRVFLSTITPDTPGQKFFLRDLESEMRARALEPVRMNFDAYDAKDPVGKVVKTMKACDGFLAVGLSRSHAYYLKDREGSSEEKEALHRFYTSGWLHLEAGIAYGLGKPVLAICEKDLAGDGIFDRSWNSSPPFVLTASPASADDPMIGGCLDRLRAEVEKSGSTAGMSQPVSTGAPSRPALPETPAHNRR